MSDPSVVSKIAISISMFHLGLHTRRVRIAQRTPSTPASPTNWSAKGWTYVGPWRELERLPVAVIRDFGGDGGQANVARRQSLIARNR